MPKPNNDDGIRREGLTFLHEPRDAVLDVFIIHGLNGSPYSTFRSEESGFFWPRDLFRHLPPARVAVFGYNANIAEGSDNSMGIQQHAENLLLQLRNNYTGQQRPIVFIGHSLGGLVIKQTLILSSNRKADADILRLTKVALFFGVPHRGSPVLQKSKTRLAMKIGSFANHAIPPNVLPTLTPGANEAYVINTQFMQIKTEIAIVNFYEQSPQRFVGGLVVDRESAVFDSETSENVPVLRDHRDLVRFHDANDDFYHTICQTLHRMTTSVLKKMADANNEEVSLIMKEEFINALSDPALPSVPDQSKLQHPRTLQWLLEDKGEFGRWIREGGGIFAIAGKPGSGKSVLMSVLNRVIRKHYTTEFPIAIHHFFNSRGRQVEQSVEGFLRSVLVQLVQENPSLFENIKDDWSFIRRGKFTQYKAGSPMIETADVTQWTLSDLTELFFKTLKMASRHHNVFILVDGVDECQPLDFGFKQVIDLFQQAVELCDERTIHICFSCRDTTRYKATRPSSSFNLHEKNEPDILNFIEHQWSSLSLGTRFDPELRQLKKDIVTRADGIFLWVTLVLENIQNAMEGGATMTEVKSIINTPDQLYGVFSRLLGSIDPAHISDTQRILAVILTAKRPLSLKELRYVLALDDHSFDSQEAMDKSPDVIQDDESMKRRIRNRCGGLVEVKMLNEIPHEEVDEVNDNSIRFIHQSVRDFLEQEREKRPTIVDLSTLMRQGHSLLGRACVAYLCLAEVQDIPQRLNIRSGRQSESQTILSTARFPLLRYAEEYWMYHGKEIGLAEDFESPGTELAYSQLLNSAARFNNWRMLHNKLHPENFLDQNYDANELAVKFDLAYFVETRCMNGLLDVDFWTQTYGSYLHLAIFRGSTRTVQVLLRHGANIEARGHYNNTALADACRNGNIGIAKLLLEAGAKLSESHSISIPLVASNDALKCAVLSGKVDLVKYILDYASSTYANPRYRYQAIEALVSGGLKTYRRAYNIAIDMRTVTTNRAEIFRILCEGIDNDHEIAPFLHPACIWAFSGCQESYFQALTDAYRSSLGGYRGLVRPFINMACLFGTVGSVRMLMESVRTSGELPDWAYSPDSEDCFTPVHFAAMNPSCSILSYLLGDLGLSPDSQDLYGQTPLHIAASESKDAHIAVLLSYNACKEITSYSGCLPLHQALQSRKFREPSKIFEKLLNKDSDVNLPVCDDNIYPLHLAAGSGALAAVEWLLEKDADIKVLDEYGRTVLQAAASSYAGSDTLQILEILLARGQDIGARDGVDMTPLHHVLYTYDPLNYADDPDVALAHAKLLLRHGADVNAQDQEGNTLLHLAAWEGHEAIIRLCLRNGAVATKKDHRGLMAIDLVSDDEVRDILEAASEE